MRLLGIMSIIVCSFIGALGEPQEFSHYQHIEDEGAECSDCHIKINETASLKDIKKVQPPACYECHEDEFTVTAGSSAILIDPSFKIKKRSDPNDVHFSHAMHTSKKISCEECHGKHTNDTLAITMAPHMDQCMDCHETQAANECLTCHQDLLQPASHLSSLWLRSENHGALSQMNKQDCARCHREKDYCTDCHMGVTSTKVHEFNYRYTHGVDVTFKRLDCASCHQPVELFCADCHEGIGNL